MTASEPWAAALNRVEDTVRREIEALRREVGIWREADQRALSLQQGETARRLDESNHALKLAVEKEARTVPRDLFELYRTAEAEAKALIEREHRTRFEGLSNRLGTLEATTDTRRETGASTTRWWITGISLIATVASIVAIIVAVVRG